MLESAVFKSLFTNGGDTVRYICQVDYFIFVARPVADYRDLLAIYLRREVDKVIGRIHLGDGERTVCVLFISKEDVIGQLVVLGIGLSIAVLSDIQLNGVGFA